MKIFSLEKYIEHYASFLGREFVTVPNWAKVLDHKEVINSRFGGPKWCKMSYVFKNKIAKSYKGETILIHPNWIVEV